MGPRLISLLCLLAAVAWSAGCGGSVPGAGGGGDSSTRSLFAPGQFRLLTQRLSKRLGSPATVVRVALSRRSAEFGVVASFAPPALVTYRWRRGRFDRPLAVRLTEGERRSLPQAAFQLAEVNVDALPELVQAGDSLEIAHARAGTIVIARDLPFTVNVVWRVNVQGARHSKQIRADAAGRILEVR